MTCDRLRLIDQCFTITYTLYKYYSTLWDLLCGWSANRLLIKSQDVIDHCIN